jgi:ribosomal protein L37E
LLLLAAIGIGIGRLITGKEKASCRRCGTPEKEECSLCGNKKKSK